MIIIRVLISIVFFLTYSNITAQENYVVTTRNDTIFADKYVEIKTPLIGEAHFNIDGDKQIHAISVRSFANKWGYFRRVPNSRLFAKHVTTGNTIDLYSSDPIAHSAGHIRSYGGRIGLAYFISKNDYYSIDDKPLKKIKYGNLKDLLSQRLASNIYLKKVKKQRLLSGLFYGIGAGMLIYGIANSGFTDPNYHDPFSDNDKRFISPFVFISAIPLAIPKAFFSKKKTENLRLGIMAYDRD